MKSILLTISFSVLTAKCHLLQDVPQRNLLLEGNVGSCVGHGNERPQKQRNMTSVPLEEVVSSLEPTCYFFPSAADHSDNW